MEATRNSRKSLTGTVTSRSGDKTVKVTYFYKIPHPLYRKEIKRKTVVHVHDEANDCGLGDKVEIMETRPLSKLKRWRVTKVLERAPKIGEDLEAFDEEADLSSEELQVSVDEARAEAPEVSGADNDENDAEPEDTEESQ